MKTGTKEESYSKTRIKFKVIVMIINLAIIILFGLIGYSIDKNFESTPLYTVVFVLLSFPVSLISSIKVVKYYFGEESV